MNFESSTKLGSGHPYQHVPEKYKAYCSIKPEKQAYKVRILKDVLARKSRFKVFGGCSDEKFHISAIPAPIWLKFGCETFEVYMY